MNRNPPAAVKRQLRQEVGFGCPYPGCGNPYLGYHHFDPPWHLEQHHRPEGMIALCGEHHPKADAGTFTIEQLRAMKASPYALTSLARGRFDWLRRQVVYRVGGTFFVNVPIPVAIRGEPVALIRRDDNGMLLLSVRMPTLSGQPRLHMVDHEWRLDGSPTDFECPPSGRKIHAKYDNGDEMLIEFLEVTSRDELRWRYRQDGPDFVSFPAVIAEVSMTLAGSEIAVSADGISIPGLTFAPGAWITNYLCGFSLGEPFLGPAPFSLEW